MQPPGWLPSARCGAMGLTTLACITWVLPTASLKVTLRVAAWMVMWLTPLR